MNKKKRFINCDLNRCFGDKPIDSNHVEYTCAQKLKKKIHNKFDFLLDLHSTTTNMGLTVILTTRDARSQNAAAYLQQHIPDLKIIETENMEEKCSYTNRLATSSLTIEVGPVSHNTINSRLIFSTYRIVELLLNWNSEKNLQFKKYYLL